MPARTLGGALAALLAGAAAAVAGLPPPARRAEPQAATAPASPGQTGPAPDARPALPRPNSPPLAPWSFRADFAAGLTGWMSFPLAQDIGFDPTLYTAPEGGRTVLVRQLKPLGRKRLLLGVVRPIDFFAGRPDRFQLEYALKVSGRLASLEMILAGASGRRYAAPLPREPGPHAVTLSGNELRLPGAPAEIQAVVLLGRIEEPPAAAEEQLTVRRFEIDAERRPEAAVAWPRLARSVTGEEIVSRDVLGVESPLKIKLQPSSGRARVELDGPAGQPAQEMPAPAAVNAAISVSLGPDPKPGLWTAKITSGAAETTFNFLVLGRTPPHPRVLLSAQRLEQLRTLPEYAELRERIHRQARQMAGAIAYNAAAGDNIAQLPGGTGLYPGFVGELKAYFQLLEGYANAIADNALDYSLNGDRASLVAARRALLTAAKWKTWTPPRFTSHGEHTYYEAGIFAQRAALGYDLIAAELSPEEKEQIADAFWRQIISPTVNEYFLSNRMPVAASNWMANSLGGAIAADVAVEGDAPEWKEREGGALAMLLEAYERLLGGLFPGDGSEAEPAGYENFAMEGLSWGAAALQSLGIRPAGLERMWEGFWWPYYAMVRPGLVLDTGDFDGHLEKLPGFAWGAEQAGIPALREFYGRSETHLALSGETGVGHTGRALEQASGPLDLTCCTRPAAESAPPPPSRIFAERGSAVLRSGWGPRATVISLRVGAWFNHEHHDEGSFQAAAFGEKLIGEAGYSGYYDDPNYPVYFIQAAGHNTVLVDGDPFSQAALNGRYWAAFDQVPRFKEHLLSRAFDFLAADLTSAYAGQLSSYEREFVFIKPDVLVVRDRIGAPRAHVYTWLLHAPAAAEVSSAGERASIEMPGAAVGALEAGAASGWKIKAVPISIIKFDDLDRGTIHTRRELCLESERGRAADFLVGLRFTAQPAGEPQMRELKTAAGEGIAQEGEARLGVVFRTRAGALRLGSFSTDGDTLAVEGEGARESVLAAGARRVEEGGKTEFRSEAPVSVAWQAEETGIELAVNPSAETGIEIATRKRPEEVRVDGAAARFEFRGGMAVLKGLKEGEHRVAIGY